jgi:hypothetical protein
MRILVVLKILISSDTIQFTSIGTSLLFDCNVIVVNSSHSGTSAALLYFWQTRDSFLFFVICSLSKIYKSSSSLRSPYPTKEKPKKKLARYRNYKCLWIRYEPTEFYYYGYNYLHYLYTNTVFRIWLHKQSNIHKFCIRTYRTILQWHWFISGSLSFCNFIDSSIQPT